MDIQCIILLHSVATARNLENIRRTICIEYWINWTCNNAWHNCNLMAALRIYAVTVMANYMYTCLALAFRLRPAGRRFQPPPSPVVVNLAASEWSDVHGCLLLAIVRFRWLKATSGTVCRPTSPQLQRWSPRNFSFLDHFLPNCFWFLVLYTVYGSFWQSCT